MNPPGDCSSSHSTQPTTSSEELHAALARAINAPARLAALDATGLLDTPPEVAFDRLTQLARRMLRAPVALVSLIDSDRQFFKSAVGRVSDAPLPHETPLEYSFCKHTLTAAEPFVVHDARRHPAVRDNPAVNELGVVAYAGIPLITSGGHTLGAFCALDVVPRAWTPDEVAILQDLAAAALTEIELRITARRLRDSLADLRRSETQRDNLMRMVVHDLRTPLSSYLVGVQAIEAVGDLNPTQSEMLKIAIAGGWSLQRMIDDLLDLARQDAVVDGKTELKRSTVAVQELAQSACAQIEQLTKRGNLHLTTTIEAGVPPISVDESLIERVLVNLLGNAVKFTLPGGVIALSARNKTLHQDGSARDVLEFRVADTGPGIAAADFGTIFQLFGQARHFTAGQEASSGIGLAFCKMAVEAHGGTIGVESELGKGSTFYFSLPR